MSTLSLAASIVLGGWLMALVLGIKLARARRSLRQSTSRSRNPDDTAEKRRRVQDAIARNLIVLRLELQRLAHDGDVDPETSKRVLSQIDDYWTDSLLGTDSQRFSRDMRERRDAGWRILAAHGRVPLNVPPWEKPQSEKLTKIDTDGVKPEPVLASAPVEDAPPQKPHGPAQAELQSVKEVNPASVRVTSTAATADPIALQSTAVPAKVESDSRIDESIESARQHAWQPAEPGALEKVLHAASGWPRAMMPFLVQNIGWFIGVFCFLAGSVFLILYTSGFAKALTVFIVVFCYTGFLIWAGYQLCLKQPKAKAASTVLMVMGMLLVPLDISAGARLLMSAGDSWTLLIAASLAVIISLGVFAFAAQVISGVMDRVLQGQFSRLFLMLAGCQLLAPLLFRWPLWSLLALSHGVLLGLLSYGMQRYANTWIHSIFVERHKIAYFAAGSLLYAALVSFVHLTWGTGITELPRGYYAPYVMLVCGLMFYVDARFKTEVHRYSFLSHFTFFIYAVSVCAVVLALDAPLARIITLGIAAVVYGLVLWKYLTLIPLYLLLGALGGLYASLVLQHFPHIWHFLLSLAPLYGLLTFCRWARGLEASRLGAMRLALMSYRLCVALLIAVAAWSLAHSSTGMLAVGTASILAAALWWVLKLAPGPLLGPMPVSCNENEARDLRDGPWLYTVILAVTLALIFMPPWSGTHWDLQLAFGFALLAVTWAWLSLRVRRLDAAAAKARAEVFANSALLSAFAGLGIGGGFYTEHMLRVSGLGYSAALSGLDTAAIITLLLALGLSSGVFVTLSLTLYVRWLFYLFLLTVAVTAGVVKYSFFPAPSAGVAEMLVVLVLWGLLWWLERQPDELSSLRRMRSLSTAPPRLLWLLQTGTDGEAETNGSLNSPDAGAPTQSAAGKASGASPQEGGLHG